MSLPSSFQLASDEVHSWCASLDVPPETSARLYATLTPDERARSARFQFERDQRRFIVARGVLRDLLGRYLQTRPGQISFVYNAFGKPDLGPEFANRLKFNLSHSGPPARLPRWGPRSGPPARLPRWGPRSGPRSAGFALIAIATASDVGVDLEYIRAESDYAEIARRFFSAAEVDDLIALPSPLYAEAFFSCWTKKEAYLKACGEGLAIPLNSFSVPLTTDPAQTPEDLYVASKDSVPARRWSLYTLRPAPGYAGALAVEGTGWRLRQWQWKETNKPAAPARRSNIEERLAASYLPPHRFPP
jgi:4'-phosphopantetheinyl transferase